jgi:hypothetical protein
MKTTVKTLSLLLLMHAAMVVQAQGILTGNGCDGMNKSEETSLAWLASTGESFSDERAVSDVRGVTLLIAAKMKLEPLPLSVPAFQETENSGEEIKVINHLTRQVKARVNAGKASMEFPALQ